MNNLEKPGSSGRGGLKTNLSFLGYKDNAMP